MRALRYFAVLLFLVSFLWWTLLFVSIFVSPPGMHARGSGFFDFSYTFVALGNLAVAILFFAIPSRALGFTNGAVALLLLIDMIIVVAIPQLRHEEGWVGITSVVWATLMALYAVLTNRVVAWGKQEEEERLTGRRERRHTLLEWAAITLYSLIMLVIIVAVVLMTATLILRARDASLEVPGQRYGVDGDKYQVHVECVGNATSDKPTLLIEAGERPYGSTLRPFAADALARGTVARVCAWDRPGIAFSDNAPSPHSAGMSTEALTEALAQAGESGPWTLLAAGVGAIHARIFASRHLGEVVGLLLVDPLHEDLLWRVGDAKTGFFLWAYGVVSPLGLRRLGGALFQGRTREDRVYGKSVTQGGKWLKAALQENLVATSLTATEIRQARIIQKNTQGREVPLAIVSSGVRSGSDADWKAKQEDLTKLTDRFVGWDTVKGAPHEVWESSEGRRVMGERLSELVKLAS